MVVIQFFLMLKLIGDRIFLSQGNNNEFVLLVSIEEGSTKTFQYDGFKFYDTPITFTGGSFGRGVSKMRTYKMTDDFSVIGMSFFPFLQTFFFLIIGIIAIFIDP